jgi:drug/metabolite transporter (DMT)-like permease
MPLTALLLVLGAAVCHSVWNLLIKAEPRRVEAQFGAITVGALLATPVLLVYSLESVPAFGWLLVVVSALFETAYVFALSAAYGAGDLSVVYPVARGTAAFVVAPLAIVLLGERLSVTGMLGISLVVFGIAVHASEDRRRDLRDSQNPTTGIAPALGGRAFRLAALTGLMTAGYSLVNKLGVTAVAVPLYGFLVFALDAVFMNAVLIAQRRASWPLRRGGPWRVTIGVGLLMIAAYFAVLSAMVRAPVAYVVAGREVSIVIATALGTLVFGEGRSAVRLSGAFVIFLGLVLIASSR